MPGLRGSRKRQSRLSFTPLPSSSPAAKGYHKQIQDRAAAVSLDVSPSPSKKRRPRGSDLETAQSDGLNDSTPIPEASLEQGVQNDDEDEDSGSEPVRSTQRRSGAQQTSNRRAKQQRLDFSSARDPDTFSSPIKLSSPSRPQSSRQASMFSSQRRQRPTVDVSSDESDAELPPPGKFLENSNNKGSNTTTRSAQRAIQVDSDSEGDNIVVSSQQTKPIEGESEDEDDDMPTAMGTQRRKRAQRSSHDSFNEEPESESEVEIVEKPKSSKKRRRAGSSEDEDDGEVPVTPSRRRLKRPRQMSQREKDDLAEDLDDLRPSSDEDRKPRNTQSSQKNARSTALEKLRRKRSGLETLPEEDDGEDNAESDDDDEPQFSQAVKSSQMFNEDEYDGGFIEEDDNDGTLGVPSDLPLEFTRYASMKPKELFKYAVEWMVQKKINPAFQMTDKIYDLTFRKLDDEATGLTGSKFVSSAWTPDFKVSLESRPDIAFEHIDRTSAEHFMRDHCDACNRTNHPATFQVQFQGNPYHRDTLEEVAGNDYDEDEDEDESGSENGNGDADDQPVWNAQGQQVPPVNKIFYIGKFCMSNASTSHALRHWRYHLNEWVVNWLTQQGYNTPAKIVERDQLSTKKRRKRANGIVDRMEKDGVIKTLWRDFRQNIDDARNAKQGGRYS